MDIPTKHEQGFNYDEKNAKKMLGDLLAIGSEKAGANILARSNQSFTHSVEAAPTDPASKNPSDRFVQLWPAFVVFQTPPPVAPM